MIQKPDECSTCALATVTHHVKKDRHNPTGLLTRHMTGFCMPEGIPGSGVAFVAEASGENEEEDGKPLRPYAQAGSIHERVLRSLGSVGAGRKNTMAFNVLACRPPDNRLDGAPYELQAISHCSSIRNRRIADFRAACAGNPNVAQPVIVALGDIAFRTLTGLSGKYYSISYARGYPVQTQHGLVVGTYHPAYVRRNTKFLGVITEDYLKAFTWAREGFREYPRNYTPSPTQDDVRAFRERVIHLSQQPGAADGSCGVLSFDFETLWIEKDAPKGTYPALVSVQFSLGPGEGIFLDVNRDTMSIIHEIMGSKMRKATHNGWDFDCPLALFWKIPLGGIVDDTLWMAHHDQPDLIMEDGGSEADADFRFSTSASLQSVASFHGMDFLWKHLRAATSQEDAKFYGIADVDACSRIMRPDGGLPAKMKRKGIWNGYERYVRQFMPILQKMAERGIPLNRIKQRGLDTELAAIELRLDDEVQRVHPDELKRLSPANGYVKQPKLGDKIRWVPTDQMAQEMILSDGYGNPNFGRFEYLDEGTDVEFSPDGEEQALDASEGDVVIAGKWRPMVQRSFHVENQKQTVECNCLYDPKERGEKRKGLSAFSGKRPVAECQDCNGKGKRTTLRTGDVVRWARLLPFRASNKQLVNYISFRGHKIPYDRQAKKYTTAAKGIQELAFKTKDPLYQTILDVRTVSKVRSTYLTGKGWVVREPDNRINWDAQPPRVHTTFSLGPATGQTNSMRPGVQNTPKHTRNQNLQHLNIPTRFRQIIEARPGRRIWEFDLKSAHALTLGLEARCVSYMRLARLDVHSFMTAILAAKRGIWPAPISMDLVLNGTDKDLKAELKRVRAARTPNCLCSDLKKVSPGCPAIHFESDIRDVQAKPAILGKGFGMQGRKLWTTNKESFENEFEAQAVINDIDEAFPELPQYSKDVLLEAHTLKYLISRGGFIRRFWHVYDFKYDADLPEKWKTLHGDDAEDVQAFRPANDAFVYIRDAMLRLEERTGPEFGVTWSPAQSNFVALDVNELSYLINTVHDSLVCEMPIEWEDRLAPIIKQELERKQMLLGDPVVAPDGLYIECEAKAGGNWGDMKDVNI